MTMDTGVERGPKLSGQLGHGISALNADRRGLVIVEAPVHVGVCSQVEALTRKVLSDDF